MSHYNRLALPAAVLATAAGAFLTGCQSDKPDTGTGGLSVSSEASSSGHWVPGTEAAYDALPIGPCEISQSKTSDPQACINAYERGTVVLVNFGALTPEKAQDLARVTQETLRDASKGILNLTVTVVPASPQAKTALGKERCINMDNPSQYAASIAQETMPELGKFSFVETLSNEHSCNNDEEGRADTQKYRGADVYVGQGLLIDVNTDMSHEFGHLVGLGHSGSATNDDGRTVMSASGTIDLPAVVKRLDDDVYESGPGLAPNPMGDAIADPGKMAFSPAQLDSLEWPYHKLNEQPPGEYVTKLENNTTVGLSCQQASKGQAVTFDLPTRVSFRSFEPSYEGKRSFDEVVFTPETTGKAGCELATGVDVSVYDTGSYTTVDLGNGEHSKQVFVAGNKRVTVTTSGDRAQFSESDK